MTSTKDPNAKFPTDYVGHVVVDANDHEIGTVTDAVYEDDATSAGTPAEQPTWLVADPGLLRAAHFGTGAQPSRDCG